MLGVGEVIETDGAGDVIETDGAGEDAAGDDGVAWFALHPPNTNRPAAATTLSFIEPPRDDDADVPEPTAGRGSDGSNR